MLDSYAMLRLYVNVLNKEAIVRQITEEDIRKGICQIAAAYSPEVITLDRTSDCELPNYNLPAVRCAYLHKYSPFHTYVVTDVMLRIFWDQRFLFCEPIHSGNFNFCCLGGGPGTDVIGTLAAMNAVFHTFRSSATIVDCMDQWKLTFMSVLQELEYGSGYGEVWRNLSDEFQWNYIGANLLNMTDEANAAIASANLVIMVKFVSAASCTDTERMLEEIFCAMKPGAYVVFIDNAGGGFSQVMERASRRQNLQVVMPPRCHVEYENYVFQTERFGNVSCFRSRVTVKLLKKPLNQQHRSITSIPFSPQTNSSNSSAFKENLNEQHAKIDPNASELNLKKDDLNLSRDFKKTNSKWPLENEKNNLNLQHKLLLEEKKGIDPAAPCSPLSHSSGTHEPAIGEEVNLDHIPKRNDFKAASNKSVVNDRIPSSSRASPKPPVVSPSNSATDSEKPTNQQSDNDADGTSCSCCIIS